MADIIRLLPDSVANQIAAGEVVQRPSSVVKELVENAIDSGADYIQIILKDGGKTSIQVTDNGCGMSDTDARMAFERHATSKINKATDLFAIRTKGFRGEALASIASVAEVELKTRPVEEEVGTHIIMRGSELISQEVTACSAGSNFSVKNLFYNVPARRKFLKAASTELRSVITEFQRITIAHPDIKFKLINNDTDIHFLPVTNYRQRIVNLFGKHLNSKLVNVESDTYIAKIFGFTGNPKYAKKTYGEQFFFVNNRFIKHPYLHKAIMKAYEKLLPPETIPSYFIFFDVNPDIIDINIHPTKTEIKFQDESALFQILNASVRESLGKFNIIPSLDFDEDNSIELPAVGDEAGSLEVPKVDFNPNYNPFNTERQYNPFNGGEKTYNPFASEDSNDNLEAAGRKFESAMNKEVFTEEDMEELMSKSAKGEPTIFQEDDSGSVEVSTETIASRLSALCGDEPSVHQSAMNNDAGTHTAGADSDKPSLPTAEEEQGEDAYVINEIQQKYVSAMNSAITGEPSGDEGGAEPSVDDSEGVVSRSSAINTNEDEGLYTDNKVKAETRYIQLKNRYIITPVRSGIMIIDQKRAHEKILYEKFMETVKDNKGVAQQTLFPKTVEFDAVNANIIETISEELCHLGFDIRPFGNNTFVVHATPAELADSSPKEILDDLLEYYKSSQGSVKNMVQESVALSLAHSSAIHYSKTLTNLEMSNLIDSLFGCDGPNYTVDGKTIITIVEMSDIMGRFK